MMEFHISRISRERYQVAETLFSYDGNVVFADLAACRTLTYRMNKVRDAPKYPDRAVHAGAMFAMGLIDEASHVVFEQYRKQFDPEVITAALDWFSERGGSDRLDDLLVAFVEHFPGQSVMRGAEEPHEWLAGSSEGMSHRAAAMEELLMLWTANRNKAFNPFEELFDERGLAAKTVYRQVKKELPEYFATRPLIPVEGAAPMNLLALLRAPAERAPNSLSEQLSLIRKMWKPLLGDNLDRILMIAGEILREEELAV